MKRISGALARRALAQRSGRVNLLSWEHLIAEDASGYHITATLRFRYPEGSARGFYLDFGRWPLGYTNLNLASNRALTTARGCLALPGPEGLREDDLIFSFLWPRGENRLGHVMSLPTSLPRLVQASDRPNTVPLPTIRAEALSPHSTLLFFPPTLSPSSATTSSPEYFFLTAIPQQQLAIDDTSATPRVGITAALASLVGPRVQSALVLDTPLVIHRLTKAFGVDVPTTILLADESSLVHNRGAALPGVIILREADLSEQRGSSPWYYELTSQAVELWWGGMCRSSCSRAHEVMEAIAIAMGFQVALELSGDDEGFARGKRRLQAWARRSLFRDSWEAAHGDPRRRILARLALILLSYPDLQVRLAEVLRKFWGHSLSATLLLRELDLPEGPFRCPS